MGCINDFGRVSSATHSIGAVPKVLDRATNVGQGGSLLHAISHP
jgi:hypothetical protein